MPQDNYKKWFWSSAILSVLVLALSAWIYASSYSKMVQPGAYRNFAVSAESRVTAKNDIAEFSYGVLIEGGKDISQIKKQSDELTAKIQKTLKDEGVDLKDVKTVSYNLEPRYQNYNCAVSLNSEAAPCKPAEIVGYTLSQTDLVKIRDLSKVDKIVSGVVAGGANNVSQLTFTVDDQTALKTQAKAEAIKKAIEQAKVLASAGGFKIGKIISIDEVGVSPVAYDRAMEYSGMMAKAVTPTVSSLNSGSGEIVSSVIVRFEIK